MMKRAAFRLVLLLVVGATVEAGAWGLFWLLERVPFSYGRLAELRAAARQEELLLPEDRRRNSPYALHPYLGYVYNPDINSAEFTAFHGNPVSDFGFLDAASPIRRRAEDRLIVGVFGGSVAYYLSARGMATLEARLAESPRFAGKRIEVVRAALGGYRQPQQLMALNYLLMLGGELDVLINLDGFNEVALYPAVDAARRASPLYPSSWPDLVSDVPERRALVGEVAWLRRCRRQWAGAASRGPLALSVTAGLVWRVGDRWLQATLARDVEELGHEEGRMRPYYVTGPRRRPRTVDETYSQLAEIWKRGSLQMDRLCRANGIDYYHFLQPNQYVPGSKVMGDSERRAAFREDHQYRTGVLTGYPYLQYAGTELVAAGVRFHDLTEVFHDVSEPTYEDPCCHLDQLGNDLLAEAIARAILEGPAPER